MSQDDLQAINDRLDRQDKKLDREDEKLDRQDVKLDKIMQGVTRQVAVCEPTRTRVAAVCDTVYGNGRDGLKGRVTRLETVREIGGKGFWALVALVSTILAGAILAVGGMLMAALKG